MSEAACVKRDCPNNSESEPDGCGIFPFGYMDEYCKKYEPDSNFGRHNVIDRFSSTRDPVLHTVAVCLQAISKDLDKLELNYKLLKERVQGIEEYVYQVKPKPKMEVVG